VADQEIIFTVEDAPEGGYTARALGYAIFTQGETLEELRQMVRDAVNCHFEKENKPRLIRLHMVKDEVIVAYPEATFVSDPQPKAQNTRLQSRA